MQIDLSKHLEIDQIRHYHIKYILPHIGTRKSLEFITDRGNFDVKMNTLKLRVFKEKSLTCASCPLKGNIFILERLSDTLPGLAYLNLYAYDIDNRLVLMTRDHIIPTSKGGKNTMKNSQTMCFPCNQKKGDKIPINHYISDEAMSKCKF